MTSDVVPIQTVTDRAVPRRRAGQLGKARSESSRRSRAADPALLVSPVAVDPPRIAIYRGSDSPPAILCLRELADSPDPATLIDALSRRVYTLAREQGGSIPLNVVEELVANLIHASFAGVVVTILDNGNTLRISDRGPGICDKTAALRPGFTSADASSKQYIRGVGSGFTIVKDTLERLGGSLDIEDNLGQGTVVTVRMPREVETALPPTERPAYNLSERQLKTLLLTVELAPVGPTRLAQELGVSASTAYRDLMFLEHAGLVASEAFGQRTVTEAGLAFLRTVLC